MNKHLSVFVFVLFAALSLLAAPLASGASAYPTSCYDIAITGNHADGEYTIAPAPDQVFSVYCYNMQGWPKEYLTLVHTGGSYNFSQFTAGGYWPNSTVRSTFTKIRIDPTTLLVDIADLTFATSTSTEWPNAWLAYGVAADCAAPYAHTGIANIDLTGTPFVVYGKFFIDGYYPGGTAVVDGQPVGLTPGPGTTPAGSWVFVAGKTVDLTGGGYSGGIAPEGYNSNASTWGLGPSILALKLKLKTPPTSTAVYSGTVGCNGIYVSDVTVAITAQDLIGVKEIHYLVNGVETIVPGAAATIRLSEEGKYSLSFFAVDSYGNAETAQTTTITINDKEQPLLRGKSEDRCTGRDHRKDRDKGPGNRD